MSLLSEYAVSEHPSGLLKLGKVSTLYSAAGNIYRLFYNSETLMTGRVCLTSRASNSDDFFLWTVSMHIKIIVVNTL